MKNCTDCKYALWNCTKNNSLHPNGEGFCQFPIKIPQLPAALEWETQPKIIGGRINRRRELIKHCTFYLRK